MTGLLAHLEELAEAERDLNPRASGLDAITISTYHGAKGLEWPTVCLASLDYRNEPDLWKPETTGGDPSQDDPLLDRRLRYWPWPFSKARGQYRRGTLLEADVLETDAGQAANAEHEQEARRLLYVGMTRARERLVLIHRLNRGKAKCSWLDDLAGTQELLPPVLEEGTRAVGNLPLDIRVRKQAPQRTDRPQTSPGKADRWIAASQVPVAERIEALAFMRPSGAKVEAVEEDAFTPEPFPGDPVFPQAVAAAGSAELGDAVHAYLASLPSLSTVEIDVKLAVARRCLEAHRQGGEIQVEALVEAGNRLTDWIEQKHAGSTAITECPVTGGTAVEIGSQGRSQWRGTIDLLLTHGESDGFTIVDHKTAWLPQSAWAAYANQYAGQLLAYRDAILACHPGAKTVELLIHLPLAGGMVRYNAV